MDHSTGSRSSSGEPSPLVAVVRALTRPDLGPLVALLIVTAVFAIADQLWGRGFFATQYNLRLVLQTAAIVAVPALGMTVIIIAGGIDLSAGTATSLCAVVLAYGLEQRLGWPMAVGCTVLTGVLCGLLNGALIIATRIVPFVVTLGTMTMFVGFGSLLTKELSLTPRKETYPTWLHDLSFANLSDLGFLPVELIPLSPVVAGLAAIFMAVLLHSTVFGRWIFAVGSNERTARLAGIPVDWVKLVVYGLGGAYIALGSLYMFSKTKEASANSGIGLELQFIAAVVIGGGSLSGGRGSVIGTLAGATLAAVIESGCIQLGLGTPTQRIIIGVAIISAVALDKMRAEPPEWLSRILPRMSSE